MKDNQLNILFLASWYPNDASPQAGNFIQEHAKAVSKQVNVTVVHVVPVIQKSLEKITAAWNNDIYEVIVYYCKTISKTPILSKYSKSKQQQNAYKKGYEIALTEMNSFDLVHLNTCYPAGLFALHLNKKENLPFIISEHWTAFLKSTNTRFSSIEEHLIKKITKKASLICPVSEHLKNEMVAFGIKNTVEVVPNVVDTNLFNLIPKAIDKVRIKIIHISNLKDEHKNISGILNTIKKLSSLRNDFHLTIAGNGDIEKYRKKAVELNIPKEVITFENDKSRKEVADLMKKSDFFLLFSNYETFSVVIAEAWACGLPIVTSKCGGLTEEVNNDNGILVPPKDEEGLLKGLNDMMNNLSQYNQETISKVAQHRFCFESVSDKFIKIYHRVIINK